MKINQASADHRRDRCALHWATVERRVATLRLRTCQVEDPFKLRIENRNVRMRTLFQRAAIGKSKDARGIGRTHLHDAFQIDEALVDEIKGESNRRFETGDAERRLVKFQTFLV